MNYAFMVDIEGHHLTNIETTILAHPAVQAVVLFTRNFANKAQLISLIQTIRATAPHAFISVDHEGGNIQRFQHQGFRSIPSARVLGEIYDQSPKSGIKLAKHYGYVMAKDLRDIGIDLSLSPVLDLHDQSQIIAGLDRALHADPHTVALLAEAYIDGMYEAGMLSVGKHFPGHGSCLLDSHIAKPVYEATLDHIEAHDLQPFKLLIQNQKLDAVMPAYVNYPKIDPNQPAGFSDIWLKKILRERMGFDGLIISDCLSMFGANIGDLKTRAQQAFMAGCDIAILANQPRDQLLSLLESLPSNTSSNKYLVAFQEKIQRINSTKS